MCNHWYLNTLRGLFLFKASQWSDIDQLLLQRLPEEELHDYHDRLHSLILVRIEPSVLCVICKLVAKQFRFGTGVRSALFRKRTY
ncbi:hypothetical protein ACJMK2_041393 [Sinanodonta woodiana]|uniref:Uncharacterized protein n=1 Tax=Sinanodonta woodiana TaxID=1069815 RepID=A0ABD3W3Z2_SINWO